MVKKIIAGVSTGVSALALAATTTFAVDTAINVDAGAAGFKINDISKLISSLLKFTLGVVGLLVFIYLIWGGIEWLTAGGDKTRVETAQKMILKNHNQRHTPLRPNCLPSILLEK